MNIIHHRSLLIALLVASFTCTAIAEKPAVEPAKKSAQKKVQTRTVTASMQHAVGSGTGIHAAPKPSPFTIKKGQTAYDFRYSFTDQKQNVAIKHRGPGNIYSVTKRKYIATAAPNPDFTLGEGKYKFFVGGTPGATGSMTFRIREAALNDKKSVDEKSLRKKADRIIETVTWIAGQKKDETKAIFYVLGNKVVGTIDQEYKGESTKNYTFENHRAKGTFTGTIAGNVIKGVWKFKILPYRVVVHGRDGKDFGYKSWSDMTINSTTTLKKGGSLSETLKITGTSNTQWDASAPGPLSGKLQSSKFTTSVPGEHVKQPMQGTWKEQKR